MTLKLAQIVAYPDDRLRKVSRPVPVDDFKTMQMVRDLSFTLRETMYDSKGWGLAAIQLGVPVGVFIVHVPEETQQPLVFVNPEITWRSPELVTLSEGCLSFKGVREPIERPVSIKVKRWNERGQFVPETEYSGWTARAIQHEYDHLAGNLLIDHMLPVAQKSITKWLTRKAAKKASHNPSPSVPA